jgi:uncharacterized protein (TIGR02145 family)
MIESKLSGSAVREKRHMVSGSRCTNQLILLAIGFVLLSVESKGISEGINDMGHLSSRQVNGGTVTDIEGYTYRTITIGAQVWMAENLRVTRYRDGTAISTESGKTKWSNLILGAYCLPESESTAGIETFGLLYNFNAVNDARGLSPEGWHVPTAEEWRTLIDYLGGVEQAGGRMRETSSGLWRTSIPGSTNESRFSAVPAGGRGRLGSATDVGYFATWWSSTSFDSTYAWHWGLYPDKNSIRSNPGHKSSGFSVRCIKD